MASGRLRLSLLLDVLQVFGVVLFIEVTQDLHRRGRYVHRVHDAERLDDRVDWLVDVARLRVQAPLVMVRTLVIVVRSTLSITLGTVLDGTAFVTERRLLRAKLSCLRAL